MNRASLSRCRPLLAAVLATLLAACGAQGGDDAPEAASAAASVADAASAAAEADKTRHPLCDTATFDDVQAAIGGHIAKLDVIDDQELPSVDCIYLDPRDVYNGLTIRFVSSARLVATASKWRTAAEYFAEWGRGGEPVANLAQGAAWVDLTRGLLVLQGDHAVHLSASKADLSDPTVRTRFEALARRVVGRLP